MLLVTMLLSFLLTMFYIIMEFLNIILARNFLSLYGSTMRYGSLKKLSNFSSINDGFGSFSYVLNFIPGQKKCMYHFSNGPEFGFNSTFVCQTKSKMSKHVKQKQNLDNYYITMHLIAYLKELEYYTFHVYVESEFQIVKYYDKYKLNVNLEVKS